MKYQKQAIRCVMKITDDKMNISWRKEYPILKVLERDENFDILKTLTNLTSLKILINL